MTDTEPKEALVMEDFVSLTYREQLTPNLERFADALLDGRLLGQKCPACGRVYLPGKGYCPLDVVEMTEADDAAPVLVRRQARPVAVQHRHVLVPGEHPEPRAVGLGVPVDGRLPAQELEPVVRHALGEDVPIEQVDVSEFHDAPRPRTRSKVAGRPSLTTRTRV